MPTVFLDSDVVVTSLLSEKGASFFLLNETATDLFISSLSIKELKIVIKRLDIDQQKLNLLIEKRLKVVDLKETQEIIKKKYQNYVLDQNDAHIIAGAVAAKTKFLLTYNLKHYKKEKIKEDFDIILFPPASFLQYLRSQ